ncbi:autoinducer 2 ABC transporter substrate-binding protein [Tenggerimyces flavus]|uniref:Autoinducer 2 ABC transporter substrate-binding protein n=1 Tax=Tenggerimyces flavus TaxID=1708749 RepID=A0ABV7YBJ8_9ACTN|nr:autoinducer 2 ABC transporter substrate-binding protein [Tenggerimyces flavus]MBM7789035.1 rhamnose transport system substrate-binding protein [Tenggerimyces flavus]
MRTNKPVLALAAVLILVTAFAGCTKKTSDQTPTGGASGDEQITVAFVPKLEGVPYFQAMNTGGQKAAKELGLKWIQKGGTTADPGAQTEIVKSLIQQQVDVLVVAPNDPDSMAPVLQEAKDKGIHVMTSDTDAPNSVREVFVNQATADGIGTTIMDSLATAMGEKGKFAIVSCGQTAANLNSWIEVEKKVAAEKYKNMQLVDTVYAGEDEPKAVSMAKDLMNAHPDLTGFIGQCTTSAPGVAKAVREAGKIGTVFTVGLGTPQGMKGYLEDGSSSTSVLWDVENLGYLTAWAAQKLAKGEQLDESNKVSDGIPDAKWFADQKMLLLGDPLQITKDNADKFNY